MESVFILQNPETCCNVSSRHTLKDSRKCSLIMQHFIMRIGFFFSSWPRLVSLAAAPKPSPHNEISFEDSEIVTIILIPP